MNVGDAEALTEQALEQLTNRIDEADFGDKHAIAHQFWLLLDKVRGETPQYPIATPGELEAAGRAIRGILSQLSDHERSVLTMYVGLSDRVADCFTSAGDRDREARELLSRIRKRYLKLVSEQGDKDGGERAAC